MTQPTFIPNSYQTPNAYVDIFLSYLTSDEWKVLSYMARRIFGFQKRQDNISLSQFSEGIIGSDGERLDSGTGLSKRTIAKCLESLNKFGLVLRVSENNPKLNNGASYALQLDKGQVDFDALQARKQDAHEKNRSKMDDVKRKADPLNTIQRVECHSTPPLNTIQRTRGMSFNDNNQLIASDNQINIKASQNFQNFKTCLDAFVATTRIKQPKSSSYEFEKDWDAPIIALLSLADNDAKIVIDAIDESVKKLDSAGYTILSPKSIKKTATDIIAKHKRGARPAQNNNQYREVFE